MAKLILDKIDLDILSTLARDCRTSYNSMGSQIGLTSKSIKARVKNMICSGVIEKFIVRVNPGALGYRTALVLVRTNNGITKDDVIQRVKQLEILHIMCIIWEELLWLPLSSISHWMLASFSIPSLTILWTNRKFLMQPAVLQ